MVIGGVESLPRSSAGECGRWPRTRAARRTRGRPRTGTGGVRGDPPAAPAAAVRDPHAAGGGRIAGTSMRAGQRVMLLYVSANHDDAEFPDADRFDIDRTMDRHLGFGHGVHFCIGAHSARLEAIVILQELLASTRVRRRRVGRRAAPLGVPDRRHRRPDRVLAAMIDDERTVRIEGWTGPWPAERAGRVTSSATSRCTRTRNRCRRCAP